MRKLFLWAAASALLALSGCGSRTLETPEALPIRTYAAGSELTLSFVMRSCSDTCSTYEAAECEVEVDGTMLLVDVSVAYSEREGVSAEELTGCNLSCGREIFAHCKVPSLNAGTYTVKAETFQADITVK